MGYSRRREAREEQERQRRTRPHRVRLEFQAWGGGWRVRFTEAASGCELRVMTFAGVAKIRSLYTRFAAYLTLADRAAFEDGVRQGRGAVELWLGDAENARLQPVK